MAVMNIEYSAKSRGDLWTANNANEVKEVVNNNAEILSGHSSSITTINNSVDAINTTLRQNTQTIQVLEAEHVKIVWLTQAQYDALVDAGTVEDDVEYNIYEE